MRWFCGSLLIIAGGNGLGKEILYSRQNWGRLCQSKNGSCFFAHTNGLILFLLAREKYPKEGHPSERSLGNLFAHPMSSNSSG